MSITPTFKPATRQGIKPLIGLYAESGCGKTYSALLLARGIAGPSGKIGMIDTEAGRGSLYADVLPGGYGVMELTAPFSPSRYVECIQMAEDANLDVLVIDSMSHEWEGMGGVLEMASDNEQRSGKSGLHCWKTPKLEHQKLVLRLLQSRLIVICCLRAKYKSRQVMGTKEMADAGVIPFNQVGKKTIVKDDRTSPIQAEDFIYEMTSHAEILPNHNIILTKCSHPALRECFPLDNDEPLGIKHGEAIARWAANPGKVSAPQKPKDETSALKSELWKLTRDVHGNDRSKVGLLEQWLRDNQFILSSHSLADLSADDLARAISMVKEMQP